MNASPSVGFGVFRNKGGAWPEEMCNLPTEFKSTTLFDPFLQVVALIL